MTAVQQDEVGGEKGQTKYHRPMPDRETSAWSEDRLSTSYVKMLKHT